MEYYGIFNITIMCHFVYIRKGGVTLYNSLRDVRYKNGDLTQKEMADKIGISLGAYSLIENGKRIGSSKTWVKIQELFNLTDEEVWKLQKPKK